MALMKKTSPSPLLTVRSKVVRIFSNPYFLFLATSGDNYHIKSENHSSMVLKYQIKVFTEYVYVRFRWVEYSDSERQSDRYKIVG